jgi:hypothetical protein
LQKLELFVEAVKQVICRLAVILLTTSIFSAAPSQALLSIVAARLAAEAAKKDLHTITDDVIGYSGRS